MEEKIALIKKDIDEAIKDVQTSQDMVELKSRFVGPKGSVSELSKGMKDVPAEKKKEVGMMINEVRTYVTDLIEKKENEIQNAILNEKLNSEKIDVTLPGTKIKCGAPNILEKVIEEVASILLNDVNRADSKNEEEKLTRLAEKIQSLKLLSIGNQVMSK